MIGFIFCIPVFKLHWRYYIESTYNTQGIHIRVQKSGVTVWDFRSPTVHLLFSSLVAPKVVKY